MKWWFQQCSNLFSFFVLDILFCPGNNSIVQWCNSPICQWKEKMHFPTAQSALQILEARMLKFHFISCHCISSQSFVRVLTNSYYTSCPILSSLHFSSLLFFSLLFSPLLLSTSPHHTILYYTKRLYCTLYYMQVVWVGGLGPAGAVTLQQIENKMRWGACMWFNLQIAIFSCLVLSCLVLSCLVFSILQIFISIFTFIWFPCISPILHSISFISFI